MKEVLQLSELEVHKLAFNVVTNLFKLAYFPPPDPPVLTCPEPDNQIAFLPILSIPLGCDVCVEFGYNATLASLLCQPSTTRVPVDCVITSPEGLNPDQLVDIDGFQVASPSQISMSGLLENPEDPAPPRILGTWTCTCNNSDGVTVATSRLGPCDDGKLIDLIYIVNCIELLTFKSSVLIVVCLV